MAPILIDGSLTLYVPARLAAETMTTLCETLNVSPAKPAVISLELVPVNTTSKTIGPDRVAPLRSAKSKEITPKYVYDIPVLFPGPI